MESGRKEPSRPGQKPYSQKPYGRRRKTGGDGRRNTEAEAGEKNVVVGRNPVTEALRSGRTVEKLYVQRDAGASPGRVIRLAKDRGVPVMELSREALDKMGSGIPHQGVAAVISPYAYGSFDDITEKAESSGEDPFVIILDGIEDPHNLGAIIRSAECAGAHGVVIPKRRSCALTETVAKTSAGAIEYMPCVKVTNIAQTIDRLKEEGFWIGACDMGGTPYYRHDLTGKLAVVIGGEGSGVSRLVREKCDFVVSMRLCGQINSLNASNAAAIIAYEVRRQRDERHANDRL